MRFSQPRHSMPWWLFFWCPHSITCKLSDRLLIFLLHWIISQYLKLCCVFLLLHMNDTTEFKHQVFLSIFCPGRLFLFLFFYKFERSVCRAGRAGLMKRCYQVASCSIFRAESKSRDISRHVHLIGLWPPVSSPSLQEVEPLSLYFILINLLWFKTSESLEIGTITASF